MASTAALRDIPFRRADGSTATLADHAGQVVLVVNVASRCGLTPQYESLERLFRERRDRGLVVLGFPCNQFREQEPGNDAAIQEFCRTTYGVEFPVLSKIEVNGPARHPLYAALVSVAPPIAERADGGMRARLAARGAAPGPDEVMWNFEKFLLDRDGAVVGRFAPDIAVTDEPLAGAIDAALAVPVPEHRS
ncbi:MAG: glutathione peroxidase [Gluconacetobacter diazotrophicus]|nr:glutathione peroxidase [Gluconacetobacter diazotrophicus]